jgi:hypothetical protein
MNNRSDDAPPQRKLSPEAFARKNEKKRLNRLKLKEKKRDEKEAGGAGGADPGTEVKPRENEGKGAGRSVVLGLTNSETMKSILGIKTAGNYCQVDLESSFKAILTSLIVISRQNLTSFTCPFSVPVPPPVQQERSDLCNIDPELLSYITNEEFGNLAINDKTKNAIATVIKYRYVLCVVLVNTWKSSQYSFEQRALE